MTTKARTLFTEVLGENAKIKVIEFFVENRELDFGVADVAEETELSRQAVYNVIEELTKKSIIQKSRQLQNKQFYKLNEKSKVVKQLEALFDQILIAS